jgi:hypothetical protein
MTDKQLLLVEAFKCGIDGQNSNAYAPVVNLLNTSKKELKKGYTKPVFSLSDIEKALEYCSQRWDEEIDMFIN